MHAQLQFMKWMEANHAREEDIFIFDTSAIHVLLFKEKNRNEKMFSDY